MKYKFLQIFMTDWQDPGKRRASSSAQASSCTPPSSQAGRLVTSDLLRLQQACHSTVPFIGALDLAKYAKERCVISKISKTSLPDLCALVLHKHFDKKLSEQVSEMQADAVLTEEQLHHAAQGAYASLCIYEKLSAWKSSPKTGKRPRLDWTKTAEDRKFPGPSKTATAVRSSVSNNSGNFKTDKRPV
jgi:hypothetical protein